MNYKSYINLLALRDARLVSMPGSDGKPVNGIFIPAQKNDAFIGFKYQHNTDGTSSQVRDQNGNPIPNRFNIAVNIWQYPDGYREACANDPQNQKKENYIAPSHKVILSLRREHEENLIAQMKEYLMKNQDFVMQHPDTSDEKLTEEAKKRFSKRFRLAELTPLSKEQPTYQAPAAEFSSFQFQPEDMEPTYGQSTYAPIPPAQTSPSSSIPSSPVLEKIKTSFELSPDEDDLPF